MAKKFADISKVENLDAQIYYYTQQVRRESAIHYRLYVLEHLPKLIQLLSARRTMCADDKKESNFWTFRLGVTL